MMRIKNVDFEIDNVCDEDIFICSLGYEVRSFYLFNQIREKIKKNNVIILCFEEFKTKYKELYAEIADDYTIKCVTYDSGEEIEEVIIDYVQEKKNGTVYIDYSSMPRNWYARLPFSLYDNCHMQCVFLYVSGKYPGNYEAYPSAGINSYSSVGMTAARVDKKRLHIIGLGYDVIRTKALITILDPDRFCVCYAHEENDTEMLENVYNVNNQIISESISQVKFCINDFEFMVAKICEIVRENMSLGDVILVPDGPKPLIMAMSLVPQIIGEEGVVCLFVSRNVLNYEPVDVEPTNKILGFQLLNEKI